MESSVVIKNKRFIQNEIQGVLTSCDDSILGELVKNVGEVVKNNVSINLFSVDKIELGLIATSNSGVSISLVKSIYKTTSKIVAEDNGLFFEDETIKEIEFQFLSVYKSMLRNNKKSMWNKAQITIFNDTASRFPILNFKYDSDLDWVESLDVNSSEYNDLSSDIEARINQWDGLPKNFPRLWMH